MTKFHEGILNSELGGMGDGKAETRHNLQKNCFLLAVAFNHFERKLACFMDILVSLFSFG